jgi:hypothetical protein
MEAAYALLAGSGSRMAQSAARDDVEDGSLIYATTTLTRTGVAADIRIKGSRGSSDVTSMILGAEAGPLQHQLANRIRKVNQS